MREVERGQVVAALRAVGVEAGDGLLVHSALQYLGRAQGGVGMYLEALLEVLGPQGTVVVPAFNFAFARGEDYDPQTTPADGMGVFSEHVRRQPQARRTPHPMQSLAALGRHAEDLAGRDTPSAFDDGSPFDRMLQLDFKLLLLGADVQAVSALHYSEQRAGVPYRFWKDFRGRVKVGGEWRERTYRMYARDLEVDVHLELYPVQEALERRGVWSAVKLNYGQVSCCRLRDLVAEIDRFLREDPWGLVANRGQAYARYRAKTSAER